MPVLLYCVTLPGDSVSIAAGVCDSVVQSHESAGLRFYWSEITDPEALLGDGESLKNAASQFQQVLRQILSATTPLPFPFPTLLEGAGEMEDHLRDERDLYRSALERIGDAVQYEIVATWAADEQADLAKPISGREYAKRRQEVAERVAAVDTKLKSVTGNSAREWRAHQERRTHRWFALVPRKDRERFVASLRSAGPSGGVRLRLSGPRPPSEFVITPDNGC
jgi:Gas vesicle synthesis protein GvpL/GvpF